MHIKYILHTIVALSLASCISSTKITGSWLNPKQTPRSYSSMFVAVFSGNAVAKSTLENRVAEYLNKNNIRTLKSMNEFPPTFLVDTVDRKTLISRVLQTQMESILVITIIKKESDYRYVPGAAVYQPNQYPHNARLGDYYLYWHPCIYYPGYYVSNEIYYLETNLYDALTQELIWSAQSQTYNPVNINTFAHDYASTMVKRLKKDKMLPIVKKRNATK